MNPLLFRKGVCDPHVHIFEGKAYLYATHDAPGYEDNFHMEDWQIWSSENLIDWKLESVVHPEDFYCGGLNECWAIDAAYKDGKYYLYFSTGDWGVGVAVSDHPSGPFQDVLGEALVDYRVHPEGIPKWDPHIFQDDDGEAYLIVGECRVEKPWDCYLIARLEADMIHLAEQLRRVEYYGNDCPEDKPCLHKYNGRYYLTHSSYVAVSDNVYGPYQHLGNTGCNIDHGNYFTYHNQTYFASGGMDNPNRYLRASFLAPCHYRSNGEIVVDQKPMEYGCGQYDACWEKIDAAWYFAASKECKKEMEDGSFAVELADGEFLFFPEIANMPENPVVRIFASGENGSILSVRENTAEGKEIGKVTVGNERKSYEGTLFCREGKKNLCFVAEGKMEISWFTFDGGKKMSMLDSTLCLIGRGVSPDFDENGSNHQVLQNMELKGAFVEGYVDGGIGGIGIMKVPYFCQGEKTKLSVFVNDSFQGILEFPVTEDGKLGIIPKVSERKVTLKKGLNRIRLLSENYQYGHLAIDHVLVESEKTYAKVYPAANGNLYPRGNGCWDGLPQRETALGAYGGRLVKFLNKPGYRLTLNGINGGEGGEHLLEIHYSRGEENNSSYDLWMNGEKVQTLQFPSTGNFSVVAMEKLYVRVKLKKGLNELSIEKTGEEDAGIYLDSVAVFPV